MSRVELHEFIVRVADKRLKYSRRYNYYSIAAILSDSNVCRIYCYVDEENT